jgi:hypothetical protein
MKIWATKPTVVLVFLGILLGLVLVYMSNAFLYSSFFMVYVNLTIGAIFSSIFQYFLPAVTALLFVELKEKKAIDKPVV